MPSPEAEAHQKQREQVAEATAKAVLNEWRKVDPADVALHWRRLLPRVTAMVQAGQLTAAQQTPEYLRTLIGNTETVPDIDPEQFASQTPDGRRLGDLLRFAVPTFLRAKGQGESDGRAKGRVASFLSMVSRTIVADTGRQSDQAAMVGTKGVRAYIRVVELPACARCIILGGREYGVSTGFQRHPQCDCTMEPVTRFHKPKIIDAEDLHSQMSVTERQRVFGEAGARAIADGARISSVVNARRGMAKVEMHGREVLATYAGTGRKRNKKPPRLMPEEIYRIADDRDHAIRLLYKNGFLR